MGMPSQIRVLAEARLQMCVTHQSCLCLLQYSPTTPCSVVLQPLPSQCAEEPAQSRASFLHLLVLKSLYYIYLL